jgi:hypothetical protein
MRNAWSAGHTRSLAYCNAALCIGAVQHRLRSAVQQNEIRTAAVPDSTPVRAHAAVQSRTKDGGDMADAMSGTDGGLMAFLDYTGEKGLNSKENAQRDQAGFT